MRVTQGKICITLLHNDINSSRALLIIQSSIMRVSTNHTHMSKNISVQHKDHSTSLHKTNDDGNNNNNNNNNNNKWLL